MRNIVNQFHKESIRFNPRFAGGYAVHEIERAVHDIDDIWRCAEQSFPDKLKYIDYEICSPEETFEVFTVHKKTDRKYVYDFARTDVFLVRYHLEYDGQKIAPIYFNLPFTNFAGIMYIRDKAFYLKPVVADPLLSVSRDGLFLPLSQTKMTTYPRRHHLYKNDELITVKIYETTIHHTLREVQLVENKESKMRITCNAHYLFCKEGYRDAFLKYFNATVVAGYADTINTQNYPKEDWVIYSGANSSSVPQMTEDGVPKQHNVLLAVKRDDVNKDVESVVGAFFYVLDLLPDIERIEHLEDPAWWIIKMGKIILGNDEDHRILMKKMMSHYKAIDTYIDGSAIELMRTYNIYISDLYDYLAWLVTNMDEYMNRLESSISSLYGKHLMVNRYVFQEIKQEIYHAVYELRQKKAEKLNPKTIQATLSARLKPDLITRINSNKFSNVTAVMSSTDSRLLKMGIEMVPQDNARSQKAKKTAKMLRNPKWQWDVGLIDAGGFASMSKHEPVGKDAGNPKMNVGIDGKIHPQEKHAEVLAEVRRMTQKN